MWFAKEQVVNSLRGTILIGGPEAGERLVLSDLSVRLGASVTPTREALQSLKREGLVQLMPHKEVAVVEIDRRYVAGYYVTGTILESGATAMTYDAEGTTVLPGHLRRMEQVMEEERYQDYAGTNYDLHEAIWILVDSERVEGILKTLSISNSLARNTSLKDNVLVSPGEHKGTVKAIQMRDKQGARKKMHAHMI